VARQPVPLILSTQPASDRPFNEYEELIVGANTKSVTDQTWAADVLQSDKPVLVDFWAEWCGPCRKVAPLLDEIAASELGNKIQIVKLNIDENPNTAREYGIMSIPTLTVFKGGQAVDSLLGVKPKGTIVKMLEATL
jgi:thioredoxin 1